MAYYCKCLSICYLETPACSGRSGAHGLHQGDPLEDHIVSGAPRRGLGTQPLPRLDLRPTRLDQVRPSWFLDSRIRAVGLPRLGVLVGIIEVTGGVCLVVPRLATYGAVGLLLVMVGAWMTLARGAHWVDVAWPTACMAGLVWVGAEWRSWRVRLGRRIA